jgi:sec-independent protein translocase protein TatA
MLGGLGMPELLVILVIVLIIFGAGKLPDIGAGLGKGIRNFKKATQELPDDEAEKAQKLEKVERIEEKQKPTE